MGRKSIALIVLLTTLLIPFSCKNNKQVLIKSVDSLLGTHIAIPEELFFFNDPDRLGKTVLQDPGYKILIYLNSNTCSVCKVKEMRMWEESYQFFSDRGVPTIILVETDTLLDYKEEVDRQKIKPLFAVDVEGKFKSLNKLPEDPLLQSFFLKGSTIVLVGNPYTNPQLLELFKQKLTND